MTPPRFPGAPEGSYVCEEGWLIVADQAWTAREWALEMTAAGRHQRKRREDPVRRERINDYHRQWRARKKATA